MLLYRCQLQEMILANAVQLPTEPTPLRRFWKTEIRLWSKRGLFRSLQILEAFHHGLEVDVVCTTGREEVVEDR